MDPDKKSEDIIAQLDRLKMILNPLCKLNNNEAIICARDLNIDHLIENTRGQGQT